MTTLTLLARLSQAGVILTPNNGRVAYDAPRGTMTPHMLQTIKTRKAEVLAVLAGDWCAAARALLAQVQDTEARDGLLFGFDERAGIVEFDGGLPRREAERQAYEQLAAVAVGVSVSWRMARGPASVASRPW